MKEAQREYFSIVGNHANCVNGTFLFTELKITQAPSSIELLEFKFTNFD